jgi:branched-subunit amino acid aminotransferase/4-amino-4-deoxychorismate lyase
MDVFSRNGKILPRSEATVSLDSIEFTYGFGVYESVRCKNSVLLFLPQHAQRLLDSAEHIGLEHQLSLEEIQDQIKNLAKNIDEASYNLKILLIGAATPEKTTLYILPLRPRFVERKLYKTGAAVITTTYERYLPHAKSLNMLPSYLAHRDAKSSGAYDALLVNSRGEITEGTRTNFFAINGTTIYSPPADDVLLGVTRANVLKVAEENGYTVVDQPLLLSELDTAQSYFITSTSSKILPLSQIDDLRFEIQPELKQLIRLFNQFLDSQ